MGDDDLTIQGSIFDGAEVPRAPTDPLYGLAAAYESDCCPLKIDLGIGAYRDNEAKPWILPTVRKAQDLLHNDPRSNHEYIPIAGLPEFNSAAQRLILGHDSPAISDRRVCTFQTISGTGALHLGAALLSQFMPHPQPSIYISDPSWPIHKQCFEHARLQVEQYPFFETTSRTLDFEGMVAKISSAPVGSIILLHACAHNPTGVDPTESQWRQIAHEMRHRQHLPFFDSAYQGFASGSLEQDSFPIRHFVDQGFELLIAQSFAKNMGLYGQRVGALHYVSAPSSNAVDLTLRISSQLAMIARSEISSPPSYGAMIASHILNDAGLYAEWQQDLQTMAGRIADMRCKLRAELERLGTPGTWEHLTNQTGMFSFTGLSQVQVDELRDRWHAYMLWNGRISIAGLNNGNVEYFARAIDDVVRRLP